MTWFHRQTARWLALPLVAALVAGCDTDLLQVTDPDVVTPEQAAGPGAVPLRLAGMVRDFQEAVDNVTRYEGLFTDEMILSGTFPTRIDVDERNVVTDPDNGTLNGDVFLPLQISRSSADRNRDEFREALTDPEFEEVLADVEEGLALANLYGGYIRLYMAELYCAVIDEPKGAPISPDAAAEIAISRFEEAEQVAGDAGLTGIEQAAIVGQARALLWLEEYQAAAAEAARVDPGFVFVAEYSDNQNVQANEYYAFTWAAAGQQARWTVGDGTAANRHNERFAYYDEWVAQGLLLPSPDGINAPEVGVEITLQLLYDNGNRPILVSSWWEARMIEAEAELRAGNAGAAEQIVNELLADPTLNPMLEVNPDLEGVLGAFDPVDFTGSLQTDLPQLARARLAGLWLTGTRQATLRRFVENDNIDLYPQGTQGDDIFFPIPQQEIDNNPNLSSGCPL
ncbi:MAG: hypothetical protein ACOCVZ_04595 [Gemmatimonadota bacterium]